jgi:hypothetical protein
MREGKRRSMISRNEELAGNKELTEGSLSIWRI